MKTASFKAYLEKQLNKEEIKEITQQVDNKFEALKSIQKDQERPHESF